MRQKKKFISPVVRFLQGAPESLLAGSDVDTAQIDTDNRESSENDARQAKSANTSVFDLNKSDGMFGRGSF